MSTRACWAVIASLLVTLTTASRGGEEPEELALELVTCTGRIAVPGGSPRGAEVFLIPSDAALAAMGVELPPVFGAAPTGLLPPDLPPVETSPPWVLATTVGSDGSFLLDFPHVFGITKRSPLWGRSSHVVLLVRHAGSVTQILFRYPHPEAQPRDRLLVDTVTLVPEGRLQGRIVDEGGQPVQGVLVRRSRNENGGLVVRLERMFPSEFVNWNTTRTDAEGRFVLRAFETRDGKPELVFDHPRFITRTAEFSPLASGELQDLGDLVVQAGARASGIVTDGSGRPVAGAALYAGKGPPEGPLGCSMIMLYPEDDTLLMELHSIASEVPRAVTDVRGAYTLKGIADGLDFVYVVADGYELARVARGETGDVVLAPEASLTVRVVDALDGEGIAGATLAAGRPLAEDLRWDLWALPVEPLSGGSFRVHRASRVGTCLTAWAPGYGWATRETLGLAAGETREVVLELPRQAVLRGRLLDARGQPLPQASVSVEAAEPWPLRQSGLSVTTDERGEWSLDGLAPGPVLVSRGGLLQEIELEAGEVRELVQELAHVLVTVQDGQGRLVSGQCVALRSAEYGYGSITEESRAGVVDLAAPSGDYLLVVPTAVVESVSLEDGEVRRMTVVLGSAPTLRLRLTDGDQPLAGDHLKLRELGVEGSDMSAAGTDADGWTSVQLPRPGRWAVSSQRRRGLVLAVVDAQRGERIEQQLAMPRSTLQGLVLDANGQPVSGTRLSLRLADAHVHTEAIRNGRFDVPWLQPGRYVVRVTGPVLSVERPVDVAEGGLTTISVRVDRGARLLGRLFGDAGCDDAPAFNAQYVVRVSSLTAGDAVREERATCCAFDVSGLSAGAYHVDVVLRRRHGMGGRDLVLSSLDLMLEDHETRWLAIDLPPRPTPAGRVDATPR